MPPSSSQASRAALVTWSVVTGILFVFCAILAIYLYVDSTKSAQKLDETNKRYHDIVTEADLTSSQVSDLKALRTAENNGLPGVNGSTPVFHVLLAQRDSLAQLVAGPTARDTASETAATTAQAALEKASAVSRQAGINVPSSDNLSQAVVALSDGLKANMQKDKDLEGQLASARQQMANQVKQFDAARREMDKTVAQVRREQQKAVADLAGYQQTKNASVKEIEDSAAADRAAAQQAAAKAQVLLAERQRTINNLQQNVDRLRDRLGENRINTEDAVTRNADGHILRVPGKDIVYIDLGSVNSITPGLTFEVYDKYDGIPRAGDPSNDDNLPQGKASIEVTRVGTKSSECHVTRQTPGTQITEGDLIANLVYDPNTKYMFMVYGDFDLDHNGVATTEEADVIKRLITQWGGKLMNKVNVDTDFVVLGKEPTVPNFSREELQDPFNAKKLADAQQALDQYQAVEKQAVDLHIPVLNQNRFLYLIGYYAQASR